MNRSRHSPPLVAWLLAIAVALPIALPLFLPRPTGDSQPNEDRFRHELVEFLISNRGNDDSPRGVMLAMSGGSCATVGPRRLSPDGVDLYVAFYYEADLGTFSGLVDVLLDGKPDFVVIQDTVFVRARTPNWARQKYRIARSFWTRQIKGLAGEVGTREANKEVDYNWRCRGWPKERSEWTAHIVKSIARIRPYSDQLRAEAHDFVKSFTTSGIPVIIASPPTNSYAVDYRSRVFESVSQLMDSGSSIGAVSLHRQSTTLPAELFPDPNHISPEENQPYRDWLNAEIMRVLREQSDQ